MRQCQVYEGRWRVYKSKIGIYYYFMLHNQQVTDYDELLAPSVFYFRVIRLKRFLPTF